MIFSQKTPLKLINLIKPSLISKGGDYKESEVIGAKELKKWNGKTYIIELTKGASTTSIIKRSKTIKSFK